MSEPKWIPGPYETNYTGNIWGDVDNLANDGDSPLIAQVFKGDFEPAKSATLTETQRATADLIAAAPEMYDALAAIMDLIDDEVLVRNISNDGDADWAIKQLPLVRALKMAQAALAKAQGNRS